MVLSGGGAKTAAHVGAARALEEAGLRPGPLRGDLHGCGDRGRARRRRGSRGAARAAAPRSAGAGVVRDPLALVQGLFARSLLRPAPFRRAIERLVPARRFADLAVPLTVSVTDLDTGELLLFGEGGEDAPAGGRALRHLRAAGLLPAACG